MVSLFGNELATLDLAVDDPVLLVKLAFDLDPLKTSLVTDQYFAVNVNGLLTLFTICNTQIVPQINAHTEHLAAAVTLDIYP